MTNPRIALSRRAFAASLAAGGVSAAFGRAFAATADPEGGFFGGQAEWVQKYDSDARLTVERSTTPVLSAETYAATERAGAHYGEIAQAGGWGQVPAGVSLKLGSRGQGVTALRRRLIASGDLDGATGSSQVFDSFVDAGVKRFQTRHGLGPTGVVGDQTITELNVPVEARLQQLQTNLVRLHAFAAGNLGQRFVMCNIPAATVETVENNIVATHHAAGVGKIDRQSPIMQTKAIEVNFNPFWTVPASIIRKDLIPKMQADANYLTDNHIRIYDKTNTEFQPTQINWHSLDATNFKFRQDTGGDFNSLGVVRINIANPYGVYMHDTPAKGVFGDDFRFVSSGCVRVQNVRDYITWLLKDTPGWGREQIDEAIRSGQRIDAKITPPVPVYWVYITAWATPDGLVQFREDIYKRDGANVSPMASAAQVRQNISAPLSQDD